jgi:hypothetical protein
MVEVIKPEDLPTAFVMTGGAAAASLLFGEETA